ncbi:enoyl-CoA hydratase/isomerase family protein [Chloroflexota bacterium]
MNNQDVVYTRKGGIATITLNRPDKMNALITEISEGIRRAVEEATKDNEIKVMVITGTGSAFSSGGDVKAMAEEANQPDSLKEKIYTEARRVPFAIKLQGCEKPVIAAINGASIGAGLDLALACDIRIASDKARFAAAHIRRGMVSPGGSTFFLPRLVGIDKACQLIWTGDIIDAREAERIGLVTMVVPHEELESATLELAEKIAKGPQLAIQSGKRAIYKGLEMDLKSALEYTAAIHQELLKTEDHKEGATAFVEKREPVFKGK